MESGGLLGGGRGAPRAQPQAPGASGSSSGNSRSSSRRAGGGDGGGGGGGPGCPELRGEAMPRRGLRAPAHSARMAWPGPPPGATLSPRRPRNGAGRCPGSGSSSGSCSIRTAAAAAAPVTDQSRREGVGASGAREAGSKRANAERGAGVSARSLPRCRPAPGRLRPPPCALGAAFQPGAARRPPQEPGRGRAGGRKRGRRRRGCFAAARAASRDGDWPCARGLGVGGGAGAGAAAASGRAVSPHTHTRAPGPPPHRLLLPADRRGPARAGTPIQGSRTALCRTQGSSPFR